MVEIVLPLRHTNCSPHRADDAEPIWIIMTEPVNVKIRAAVLTSADPRKGQHNLARRRPHGEGCFISTAPPLIARLLLELTLGYFAKNSCGNDLKNR